MTINPEEKQDYLGFGVSLLIHVAVLLFLSWFFVTNENKPVAVTILSTPITEEIIDQTSIEDITQFSETETRTVPDEALQPDPVIVDTQVPPQEVAITDLALTSPQLDFLSESDALATTLSDFVTTASGGGAANEGISSVGGAVDRLTAEIVKSATQKETLVVWLFDASLSLNAQRKQIAERLEKILSELDADKELHPIRHVVCSFGEKMEIIIKEPSQDNAKIIHAIKDMPLDKSGIENIFACVKELTSEYKSTRRKRTMLVAFTDEVGDDRTGADQAIGIATRNGVAVYVVGTPAPFGIAKTKLKFVDPDEAFDQSERWAEIEQGPESLYKMTLNISSLPIDSEPMDSGFGPHALSRLCASTGGIYFALHPNRKVGAPVGLGQIQPMSSNIQHFFEGKVMKAYVPDYRPAVVQDTEMKRHPTKQALVNACSTPRIDFQRDFKTVFDAPNQGQFVNELAEGQKTVASLLRKVDPLYLTLQQGEKASDSLEEPRWRASYFLAMGRILAIKTRLEAYNAIAGEAKTGLKAKKKDTNRWTLEPTNDSALLNSTLKKQSESAKKYLETVVKEFPGTPWALMAHEEVKIPLAFKWVESHYEPVPVNPNGAVGPPPVREDEQRKMLPKPKPPRNLDKI